MFNSSQFLIPKNTKDRMVIEKKTTVSVLSKKFVSPLKGDQFSIDLM